MSPEERIADLIDERDLLREKLAMVSDALHSLIVKQEAALVLANAVREPLERALDDSEQAEAE